MSGCAAALVPYTSDPYEKLSYSYELLSVKRPLPAERLAKEALETFKTDNNIEGTAEVNVFLGQFYKSKAYRSHAKFYIKNGDYDPTSGKSILHSERAVNLYGQLSNYTQQAKALSVLAVAYIPEDRTKACTLFDESLQAYKIGKIKTPLESFEYNEYYGSYEGLILAFKKEYCSPETIASFLKPEKKLGFDLSEYRWDSKISYESAIAPGLDEKGCSVEDMLNTQVQTIAENLGVHVVGKDQSTPHLSLVITKLRKGMFATAKTKSWISVDLYQNDRLIGQYDGAENIDFHESCASACKRIKTSIGHTLRQIFEWLEVPKSFPRS